MTHRNQLLAWEEEETRLARRKQFIIGGGLAGLLLIGFIAYLIFGGRSAEVPLSQSDPDRYEIEKIVGRFEDAVGTASGLKGVFAADALPKGTAAKEYQKYSYHPVGKPEISGTTATARVKITNTKTGDEVSQQEWTFVKDGEKWKVKSAPLP
jgi:hypothetical protein